MPLHSNLFSLGVTTFCHYCLRLILLKVTEFLLQIITRIFSYAWLDYSMIYSHWPDNKINLVFTIFIINCDKRKARKLVYINLTKAHSGNCQFKISFDHRVTLRF